MANEIIRPSELPLRSDPVASEVTVSDNGSTVAGVSWTDGVNAAVPVASQPEAEAGVNSTNRMTPLTTKQAIEAQVPPKISTAIGALNLGSASQAQSSDFAPIAQAVPQGGAGGQVLAKTSGTDFDMGWTDAGLGDMRTSEYDPAGVGANAFNGFPVEERSELKALDTTYFTVAYLTESGREGRFIFRNGDYSAQVAADPLEGIYIKADGVAATVGAWVRPRKDWKGLSRKGLDLRDFGYVADDSTDNTGAVNAAIAIANEAGNTDIMVPVGIGRVGMCDAITAPGVTFRAEGAAGQSILRGTHASTMIMLGSAGSAVLSGFGFDGIGFYGMGTTTFSAIRVFNAQEIFLNNPVIGDGLATLVTAGAVGEYSGMIGITNMTGKVPNIAAPLIRLVNGSGLFVNGGEFYNQASQGQAMDGRDFIQALGPWNTCSVKGTFAFLFDHAVMCLMSTGQQFGDVMLNDNYFDEMNEGIVLFADTGGSIANVDIHHNELTGKRGDGIAIKGDGTFTRVSQHGNVIRETKKNGIGIYSPVGALSLIGNSVTQTNEVCSFLGSIAGTTLTVTTRFGAPGGTLMVGDEIDGPGVTAGTTITAVPANEDSFPGVYTVSPSQTVASANLWSKTGHFASLYMATGSDEVTIADNSFGPKSSSLGTGYGAYGVQISGGSNFHISNNAAEGATAHWNVTGLTESSSTDFDFTYAPILTDSSGGSFTATVTGTYKRIGNRIQVTVAGNISATTATGFLRFTLPKVSASPVECTGTGDKAGAMCLVKVASGGSYGEISTYNGGTTTDAPGNFSATVDYAV